MTETFDQIAELVRRESGISLKPHQYTALQLAVGRVAPGKDGAAFLRLVADSGGATVLERLVDEVANKETSFFRDPAQLQAIDWRRLLEQARASGRDRVRVWSAACATGEEPHTLAILACETFGGASPPVSILATDISATALERAKQGAYRSRALRTMESTLQDRYFTGEEGVFTVREELRRLITFGRHNLARDPIPPLGEARFDLILCRNVLIYFEPATAERVRGSLEGAVQAEGVLVLGAADALVGAIQRLTRAATAQPDRRPEPIRRERRALRKPLGRPTTGEPAGAEVFDAEAHFLRGVAEIEGGEAAAAVGSFRRALFLDPTFGLAAFQLGRAHDATGDPVAARRAYEQALRILQPEDDRYDALLDQVDLVDVAAASRVRLDALR